MKEIWIICRAAYYSTSGIQTYLENIANNYDNYYITFVCELNCKKPQHISHVRIVNTPPSLSLHLCNIAFLIRYFFRNKSKILLKISLILILFFNRSSLKRVIDRIKQAKELIEEGNIPDFTICSVVKPDGIVGIIVKLMYDIPTIVLLQGSELIHFRGNFLHRALIKKIFETSDIIIPNSYYMKEILKRFHKGSNVFVNHLGVDPDSFFKQPADKYLKEKLKIPENKKVFISVSNLVYRKGIDLTLKSLKQVKSAFPDFIYLIVGGNGPKEYEKYLGELVNELGLSENVIFAGIIKHENLNAVFSIVDFVVLSSRDEAFGLVTLEANACGKAVIGAATGGITETIIDGVTGLLFEPGNINDQAEKILSLLKDDQLRTRLSENAYNRVKEKYLWNIRIEKLREEINRRIGGSQS